MTVLRRKTPRQLQFQENQNKIPDEIITSIQEESNEIYGTKLDLQRLVLETTDAEAKVRVNRGLDCILSLESEVRQWKQQCENLQRKLDILTRHNVLARQLEGSEHEIKLLQKKLSASEDFVSRAVVVGVILSAGISTAVLVPFMSWLVHNITSLVL